MNAISHALDLTKQSDEAFDFDFIIQLILRMNLDTYEVVKAKFVSFICDVLHLT